MKRFAILSVMVLVLGSALPSAALASPRPEPGQPNNPNCWGVVTSQRASTEHDVGEHASNPPFDTTPDRPGRAGLGNPPPGINHVSELGSFLATIDGLPATQCPED
jgi:hypothetical protein